MDEDAKIKCAFDTLSAAKRLREKLGFASKQADSMALLMRWRLVSRVATKKAIEGFGRQLADRLKDVERMFSRLDGGQAHLIEQA